MQMKFCLPAALAASTVTPNPAYAVAHLQASATTIWLSAALLCAALVPLVGGVLTGNRARS